MSVAHTLYPSKPRVKFEHNHSFAQTKHSFAYASLTSKNYTHNRSFYSVNNTQQLEGGVGGQSSSWMQSSSLKTGANLYEASSGSLQLCLKNQNINVSLPRRGHPGREGSGVNLNNTLIQQATGGGGGQSRNNKDNLMMIVNNNQSDFQDQQTRRNPVNAVGSRGHLMS